MNPVGHADEGGEKQAGHRLGDGADFERRVLVHRVGARRAVDRGLALDDRRVEEPGLRLADVVSKLD